MRDTPIYLMVKLLALTISELGTWGHPQGRWLQAHTHKKKEQFSLHKEKAESLSEKKKNWTHLNSQKGCFKKKRKKKYTHSKDAKTIWGWGDLTPSVKDNSRCWPLRKKKRTQSVSFGQWRTLIDMFLLAWVMFLLRTDRQTAPMHTGAIQGNCVKVTSLRKI